MVTLDNGDYILLVTSLVNGNETFFEGEVVEICEAVYNV